MIQEDFNDIKKHYQLLDKIDGNFVSNDTVNNLKNDLNEIYTQTFFLYFKNQNDNNGDNKIKTDEQINENLYEIGNRALQLLIEDEYYYITNFLSKYQRWTKMDIIKTDDKGYYDISEEIRTSYSKIKNLDYSSDVSQIYKIYKNSYNKLIEYSKFLKEREQKLNDHRDDLEKNQKNLYIKEILLVLISGFFFLFVGIYIQEKYFSQKNKNTNENKNTRSIPSVPTVAPITPKTNPKPIINEVAPISNTNKLKECIILAGSRYFINDSELQKYRNFIEEQVRNNNLSLIYPSLKNKVKKKKFNSGYYQIYIKFNGEISTIRAFNKLKLNKIKLREKDKYRADICD